MRHLYAFRLNLGSYILVVYKTKNYDDFQFN